MPALRHRRASGLLCHPAVAGSIVVGLLFCSTGCRAFRIHKVSDENIAAARQLSLQGIDSQQRGQWDRAETLFAAAILKCPSDERARYGYAESLWQRGAWQQAVEHMEEAVRLSGNDPERLVRLGQMDDRPMRPLQSMASSLPPGRCVGTFCWHKVTAAPRSPAITAR